MTDHHGRTSQNPNARPATASRFAIPVRQAANLAYEFDHRLTVRHAPLLSGQWLVLAQCTCRAVTSDTVQGLVDDERVLRRLACRNQAVRVERSFFNAQRPDTALIERLSGEPQVIRPHGRAWTDFHEQTDPRMVTFDARLHRLPSTHQMLAAGVALTSGGWVRVSRVRGADHHERVAQVQAVVAALAMFPHSSGVTLLCPSGTVASVVRAAQQRYKASQYRWMPAPLSTSLASYVDRREVRVVERPRASTALMRTATTLVDDCGEENWDAATSPLLDWVQTAGIPVTNRECTVPRPVEKRRPRRGRFR
ncbi:hypothetical protein SAMN05216188_13098 [Lentzea xinjiangensis]|uniref:Uncharacterized protein n=1 Tax=Lentzea xinjiangensis TaxID=402600 RepID=A0A1H9W645_9PSEU|nr:hypothetical protein [Lentzea xinjiangensis]SES29147.1 hypothetical protein SAMN05216188_13098 [Lentzea xinjiangensis]